MDEDSTKERKLRILAVVGLAICIVALWLPMVTENVYKGNDGETDVYTFLPYALFLSGAGVVGCITVWRRSEFLDQYLFLIAFVNFTYVSLCTSFGVYLKALNLSSLLLYCGVAVLLVSATGLLWMTENINRACSSMEMFLLGAAVAGMALALVGTVLPFSEGKTLLFTEEYNRASKWYLQLSTLLTSVWATLCAIKRRKLIARILGIVGVGFFALLVDFRPILIEEHRLYRVVSNIHIGYNLMEVGCAAIIISSILLSFTTREDYDSGKKWP